MKRLRKHIVTYVNLFLLGLIVRIAYAYSVHQYPFLQVPILDAASYLTWSQDIAHGNILGNRAFFVEPLYAYILAFLRILTPHFTIIIIAFQTVCGSLLSMIVYKLGQKIFNRDIGLIAGIITALYGPFVFYEFLILKTSFEVFMLALLLLLLLSVFEKASAQKVLALGIVLGLTIILKGNALIFLPLVIGSIGLSHQKSARSRFIWIGLFLVGFFVIIAPVTIRNYVVSKDFVLTNYSIGMNLYQGNWWDTDGSLLQPPFMRADPKYEEIDSYGMAEAYKQKKLKPSEVSAFWMAKTFEEIRSNPSRWLSVMKNKILLLINRVEMSDNYDFRLHSTYVKILRFLPSAWLIISLGLTGFIVIITSREFWGFVDKDVDSSTERKNKRHARVILLLFVLMYTFVLMAGHVNARYRLPLMPYFILGASVTVWYFFVTLTKKLHVTYGVVGCMVAAIFIISSIHLEHFNFINDANYFNNVAVAYLDQNNDEAALHAVTKGLAIDSNFPWLYARLYTIYTKRGDYVLAKDALDKHISIRPDDASISDKLKLFYELKDKPAPYVINRLKHEENKQLTDVYDPYFYEAMRALKNDNSVEAEKQLRMSLQYKKRPLNSTVMLATLMKQRGDIEGAQKLLEGAVRHDQYALAVYYNLANIHLKKKEYGKAADLLRKIVNLSPDYLDAWYYLGTSLLKDKQFEAALPVVQEYIKRYKNDSQKGKHATYFSSLLVPNTPD